MVKSRKKSQVTQPNKTKKEPLKKVNEESLTLKQIDNLQHPLFHYGDSLASSNPTVNGLTSTWNMKLISWNINGLRSLIKSSGLQYILDEDADIFALQEIKCSRSDVPIQAKNLKDYQSYWHSAEKSGYAGTGLYSKIAPINIKYGIGKSEHDDEGRVITAEYEKFYFVTAYVPNAGRGLVRLDYRISSWDIDFTNFLKQLDEKKPIIVCGDLNVSHNEIDLANPKTNTKNAGFTKDERNGFSNLLNSVDLIDTFRHIYPTRTGAYSFWSNMKNARSRNIGWRLDYFLISRRLLPNLCNHELRSSVMGSDHCPIVLYLNFD